MKKILIIASILAFGFSLHGQIPSPENVQVYSEIVVPDSIGIDALFLGSTAGEEFICVNLSVPDLDVVGKVEIDFTDTLGVNLQSYQLDFIQPDSTSLEIIIEEFEPELILKIPDTLVDDAIQVRTTCIGHSEERSLPVISSLE